VLSTVYENLPMSSFERDETSKLLEGQRSAQSGT